MPEIVLTHEVGELVLVTNSIVNIDISSLPGVEALGISPSQPLISNRFSTIDYPAEYPSPANCFAAGTPILLADGTTKPIEQVCVGDIVAAYKGPDGPLVPRTVTRTFSDVAREWLLIQPKADVPNLATRLVATPNHDGQSVDWLAYRGSIAWFQTEWFQQQIAGLNELTLGFARQHHHQRDMAARAAMHVR